MSDPDFEITSTWSPPAIPAVSPDPVPEVRTGNYQSAVSLATWPVTIITLISLAIFTAAHVPEILRSPIVADGLEQLRPISAVTSSGVGRWEWSAAMAIPSVASLALALIARTRLRWNSMITWAIAIVIAVSMLWRIIEIGLSHWREYATSFVLGAIVAVCALAAPNRLRTSAPAKAGKTVRGGGGWVVLFALTFVGPLAVGRWLWGEDVAPWAIAVNDPSRSLGNEATIWFTVVGIAFALALWAVAQVFPPWAGRTLIHQTVILVVAVGLGMVVAGQHAASVARACCA